MKKPVSKIEVIDGVQYKRTVYSDRLETLVPIDGWPYNPKLFNLRKAMIKAEIPQICSECSNTKNLEAHHKEEIRYFTTKKGHYYQDPKDNHTLSNSVWLCRSCHIKLHHPKK